MTTHGCWQIVVLCDLAGENRRAMSAAIFYQYCAAPVILPGVLTLFISFICRSKPLTHATHATHAAMRGSIRDYARTLHEIARGAHLANTSGRHPTRIERTSPIALSYLRITLIESLHAARSDDEDGADDMSYE